MEPNRIAPFTRPLATTRRVVARCIPLAVGLLFCACKPEATVSTGNDAAGVYTLVTVDGKKLPADVSHDATALQVRSGTFTINADGTCSSKVIFVPPSGTETAREVSASYAREGSKLNMQWKGAGKTTGTIDGITFTMNNEGMVFVYQK